MPEVVYTCMACGTEGRFRLKPMDALHIVPADWDEPQREAMKAGWRRYWDQFRCPDAACHEKALEYGAARKAEYEARTARINAAVAKGREFFPKRATVVDWHLFCAGPERWEITVTTTRALKSLPAEFDGFPVWARVMRQEQAYCPVEGR